MKKVAIVGSREWPEEQRWRIDEFVHSLPQGTVIVSGGARGVDMWAALAAYKYGFDTEIHKPKTDQFKTFWEAAKARNVDIVRAADEVVAFHAYDSHGTAHTMKMARFYGKKLTVFILDGSDQNRKMADERHTR